MKRSHALMLRAMIEKAAASLPDEDAVDAVELFPLWQTDTAYALDVRVRFDDKLYRCVQAHTSQADWTPDKERSLYTPIGLDDSGYPIWAQPTGAHDAYDEGDIVNYNGTLYISKINGNTTVPGTDDRWWKEYTE